MKQLTEKLIFSMFSLRPLFSDYFILSVYKKTSIKNMNSILKICISLLILLIIIFLIRIPSHDAIRIICTSSIYNQTQQKLPNLQPNVTSKSLESFICDKTDTNRFPVSSTTSFSDSFDVHRKTVLGQYCNIVPIPRSNWTKHHMYTEQDIAFVIFTASSFFHTRATATRDTWLSRITNYYFLSATPYPYLPVTVVPGAGENRLSNMKKLFYGLQIIYQQQMKLPVNQRQKWVYIIGCDTFILPHHLIKRLDGLDYNKPIRLGGHWGRHPCFGSNGSTFQAEFPSGGAGFFFSMKLLEIMQPHLTNYVENWFGHEHQMYLMWHLLALLLN